MPPTLSLPLALIALLLAFLLGSIPFALLLGRMKGVDIRRHGSGNVGATNAFRVLGKGLGILCLVLDMLKGWLPVTVLGRGHAGLGLGTEGWMWALAFAAIAGHMFSPWLHFRGGKGVATSLGVLLAIAPLPLLVAFVGGLLIIAVTGYVSLASMTCAALLPVLIFAFHAAAPPWLSIALTAALAVLIIWKHRSNITRLRNGTESRIVKGLGRK